MKELSLNILDIAMNSVKAEATRIDIEIRETEDELEFSVSDNGYGMSEEMIRRVTDPFLDHIFSGNQLPPFILLHVQKIIVLDGNAGFRRRVQDRVSLHGGTGGISVNENVHTVVHRNALCRKKSRHTKLRDGREDCLHRL